jgi:hypothetical protein
MDEKIDGLIDIIKYLVEVDTGISKQYTDWILEMLNELK